MLRPTLGFESVEHLERSPRDRSVPVREKRRERRVGNQVIARSSPWRSHNGSECALQARIPAGL